MRWTEDKIADKIRQNHGRGEGLQYQSWVRKTERQNTRGNFNRVKGKLIRRRYELRDKLDCTALMLLERNPDVIDIRENYRLDREMTLSVYSNHLNEKHPCYVGTDIPEVLTIDFLVTFRNPGSNEEYYKGVMSYWTKELHSKAVFLRLDVINICLHNLFNTSLKIFTQKEHAPEIINGINWGYSAYELSAEDLPSINLKKIQEHIINGVLSGGEQAINRYCSGLDKQFKYPLGTSLRVFRTMLARRIIDTDFFSLPVKPDNQICRFIINNDAEFIK